MVKLLANGGECAHVKVGQEVSFCANVELPQAAGELEGTEWEFADGTNAGQFAGKLQAKHSYEIPGTYFPVVRVISNRRKNDGYTKLRNLCRVRVVVEE